MMIPIGLSLFVVFCLGVLAWDKYVTPRRMTRPPVEKIMQLIKDRKIFEVDTTSDSDKDKVGAEYQYVIIDTERRMKTFIFRHGFHDTARFSGDLDWMNPWEQERVLSIVEDICTDRMKKYEKACAIEDAARDDRRRQAAKELYENR